MTHIAPNAEVEYVNQSGKVIAADQFRDPGLDENSWMAKEMKKRGVWRGPHFAYGCGRKLTIAAIAALAACSTIVPRIDPVLWRKSLQGNQRLTGPDLGRGGV